MRMSLKEYLEFPYKDQKWVMVICRNPDFFYGTLNEWRKAYLEVFWEKTEESDITKIKSKLKRKYYESLHSGKRE